MNNAQASNNNTPSIRRFQGILEASIAKGVASFPKGVNAERLKINALMHIAQDENLKQLAIQQPAKIAQIVYNFIALGLDMLNKECYIIPFKNDLTILKDYKGEVKLARKYSVDPIREIFSRVVYETDSYRFNELGQFIHTFDPFATDRGAKRGAYCTVIYENGVHQTEFVNAEEIQKIRNFSKSSSSQYSPWNNWEDEMWRKTAIRKAMKNISLDFGNSETLKAYQESDNDVDFNTPRSNNTEIKPQHDAFADVIEGEIEEVSLQDV